jgi:hypothetical protein
VRSRRVSLERVRAQAPRTKQVAHTLSGGAGWEGDYSPALQRLQLLQDEGRAGDSAAIVVSTGRVDAEQAHTVKRWAVQGTHPPTGGREIEAVTRNRCDGATKIDRRNAAPAC